MLGLEAEWTREKQLGKIGRMFHVTLTPSRMNESKGKQSFPSKIQQSKDIVNSS
jgi:hypothetical protein